MPGDASDAVPATMEMLLIGVAPGAVTEELGG